MVSTISSAGWPARSMRVADLGHSGYRAGGGLVVHDAHCLDRVRAVLRQTRLDRCRIGAVPPVAGEELHLEPEPVGQAPPERGELAGLVHQHAIARRQRVDQRRFPRAGARRGIDDDRMPGLKHVLHPLEHLLAELGELRARGDRWSAGRSRAAPDRERWSGPGSAENGGRCVGTWLEASRRDSTADYRKSLPALNPDAAWGKMTADVPRDVCGQRRQ